MKQPTLIDYTLLTDDDVVVGSGQNFSYLHGMNNLLIGMEKALTGKNTGDKIQVDISADQAFGLKIDFKPLTFHRQDFGQSFDRLQLGMGLNYKDKDQNDIILYVTEILKDSALLTINHPLAGKTLKFQATVHSIRDATAAEIHNGYPHSSGGSTPSCSCC